MCKQQYRKTLGKGEILDGWIKLSDAMIHMASSYHKVLLHCPFI